MISPSLQEQNRAFEIRHSLAALGIPAPGAYRPLDPADLDSGAGVVLCDDFTEPLAWELTRGAGLAELLAEIEALPAAGSAVAP